MSLALALHQITLPTWWIDANTPSGRRRGSRPDIEERREKVLAAVMDAGKPITTNQILDAVPNLLRQVVLKDLRLFADDGKIKMIRVRHDLCMWCKNA